MDTVAERVSFSGMTDVPASLDERRKRGKCVQLVTDSKENPLPLCFEITVNDGAAIVAGEDNISVLSAALTFVSARNDLVLNAGGLISKGRHDNEHIEWLNQRLHAGDVVSIRIVESAAPSTPVSRERQDPTDSEREEREYYERLKERYEPR